MHLNKESDQRVIRMGARCPLGLSRTELPSNERIGLSKMPFYFTHQYWVLWVLIFTISVMLVPSVYKEKTRGSHNALAMSSAS